MTPPCCDQCGRSGQTSRDVGLDGRSRNLCRGCFDGAVMLRAAEVKIDLLEHRMRAQARQQDRLQRENERLRDLLAAYKNGDGD